MLKIWNSIPVSNWSFAQSFAAGFRLFLMLKYRLFSVGYFFADHAWLHGAVVGMAACCATGVGARGGLMLPDAQKRAMPLTINIANSIYLYGKDY